MIVCVYVSMTSPSQGTHGGTQEKELWRSRTTCGSAASATKVALDPSGSPAVICTDGSSILIDEK
jgi:hypothetical protein